MNRVLITGIGAVTPIGTGKDGLWQGVLAERSAVRTIDRFDTSLYNCHIAASVDDFDPLDYMDAKRARRLDRYSQFAIAAGKLALEDACLEPSELRSDRAGVTIGSALGGMGKAEEENQNFLAGGLRAVSPFLALSVFAGAASCNLAIEFGLQGYNTANADSCASGPIAIGNAFRAIRQGEADVMLSGAVEAPLFPLTFGAFALIRAMSTRNHDPATACRPFDAGRDGFVMAEGAAVLVLESEAHAQSRNAPAYAEVRGFGLTNDGYHMTAPRPDGSMAAEAMRRALQDAQLDPGAIDYINAHASSTPLNDATETLAIRALLGSRADDVPVSGTKAMHGHSLGATGAIEAAICALALDRGWVPPTVNLGNIDPACALCHVSTHGREHPLRHVLSNSFGFGGINAALVLSKA